MQWDKWKCIRNLGWEWEINRRVRGVPELAVTLTLSFLVATATSISNLPCPEGTRIPCLLPRRHIGGLSQCLWSLLRGSWNDEIFSDFPTNVGKPTVPMKR